MFELFLDCLNGLLVVACGSQGSGEEEDLDEEDSLSEDSGSELPDDLQEDSEQSFGKSQPTTPSPSPPATPRPTRRRRKPRSPSFSDDENRPPSPKVTGTTVHVLSLSNVLLLDNYCSIEINRVYIYNLQQYSDIKSVKYYFFVRYMNSATTDTVRVTILLRLLRHANTQIAVTAGGFAASLVFRCKQLLCQC